MPFIFAPSSIADVKRGQHRATIRSPDYNDKLEFTHQIRELLHSSKFHSSIAIHKSLFQLFLQLQQLLRAVQEMKSDGRQSMSSSISTSSNDDLGLLCHSIFVYFLGWEITVDERVEDCAG